MTVSDWWAVVVVAAIVGWVGYGWWQTQLELGRRDYAACTEALARRASANLRRVACAHDIRKRLWNVGDL